MKRWFYIGIVLLVAVVGCKPPTTSPQPSPGGEGVASRTLEEIDSLMWRQPDSAFAMLQEFASSAAADSLDEFNGHYCQLLISELLYKNYYRQSNRKDLLKAVGYFDSIDDGFLAARAHYINGVGYAEKDSLVEACGEYLNALRMMEGHFEEKVLVGHKARFMTLTYNRLGELFSSQFMQEPAIYCCKKSLDYDRIAQASPDKIANTLLQLGKQFDKLKEYDSASYYYERILEIHPDNKTLLYRDAVCMLALSDYCAHHDTLASLDSLKRMVSQAANEEERHGRFISIGYIYQDIGQYDSAKVYLKPVLGKFGKKGKVAARLLRDIAMIEGDTVKANQYAQFLIEDVTSAANSQARVSQLNDMFQQHLQWEQERADAERQGKVRVQRNRMIVATGILAVLAALTAWLLHRRKMKEQREEANQQIEVEREAHRLESQKLEAEREAHRLEKASMSGRLKKSNQEVRELKDQIKRQEEVNAKPQQAESFTDEPICRLIMERVREGQFKAQMDCKLYKDAALSKEQVTALRDAADRHFNLFTVRLAKAYPNLTKNDLDYCCLYLLGLSDADISALMQRAYTTVNDRGRKMKAIFGTEELLSTTLRSFAEESTSN